MSSGIFSFSQDAQLDSLLDAVVLADEELDFLFEEKKNYHFLYARSAVSNNTMYAGREIDNLVRKYETGKYKTVTAKENVNGLSTILLLFSKKELLMINTNGIDNIHANRPSFISLTKK